MKHNIGFLLLVFFLIVACATLDPQSNQRGVKSAGTYVLNTLK